ncbi:hypothetical protein BGZ60DRAFT_524245 [Tricladium varicosporioides]|nr:hypothetical protein BGZ60DRAFT_524245 [Hymenoscyphus varicosporioides]
MEGPQRRDINELLTQGFFTTARGKSPSAVSSPRSSSTYLQTQPEPRRDRSRSRARGPPPPRPTVEDEAVSLRRESSASSTPPSYDPPLRGIIEQVPIILEADVTSAEAARLQKEPQLKPKPEPQNQERRFVLVPSDNGSTPTSEDGERRRNTVPKEAPKSQPQQKAEPPRREDRKPNLERPTIERKRSRQDLPSLETKVPRDIPPQFRRSHSAFPASQNDHDETPKAHGRTPQTASGEYFLSPDVMRNSNKEYVGSASAPKYQRHESFGGRAPSQDRRPSPRPETPTSEKRRSGNFEAPRSRRNTNERLSRPKQLPEEHVPRHLERRTSYDRPSTGRSSRSSNHSKKYYSSSEDEDSDSDKNRKYSSRDPKVHKPSRQEDIYDRPAQSPARSNISSLGTPSRIISPFVSPKVSPSQIPTGAHVERSETFPMVHPHHHERRPSSRPVSPHSAASDTPRVDRLNPLEAPRARPVSRSGLTPTPPMQTPPYPQNPSLPIPVPSRIDLHSPGDTRRTPSIPQFDESRTPPQPLELRPQSHWQPVPFVPPSLNLERPVGSYRRYSEDIERGSISPLPACPRTTFTRGRNDWLTLPNCPSFDICPSCYNSIIAPTEFRHSFIPAPVRSQDLAVLCDFGSSPWYRIAWLLTLKERRRDLKLFQGLAHIAKTDKPCPGKKDAVRIWHSIPDPRNGGTIANFNVCQSCVRSIETLLPGIAGVFVRKENHNPSGSVRICDLRFDSKRFVQYFDALEVTADRVNHRNEEPDTRDLVSLCKRMARMDECEGDVEFIDRKWHIITQLPEFTVCEECFDEVVGPELDDQKPLALMFNKTLQRISKASCQLYSPKMRGIFRTAVDASDYQLLASKARERRTIELAYKANMSELKRQAKANPVSAQRELQRIGDEWRRWE